MPEDTPIAVDASAVLEKLLERLEGQERRIDALENMIRSQQAALQSMAQVVVMLRSVAKPRVPLASAVPAGRIV